MTSVDPSGPAAEHGVKTGDVILNVGGKAVATVGDVRSALVQAKATRNHSVLMQVKTADATRFIAVPWQGDPSRFPSAAYSGYSSPGLATVPMPISETPG